MPLQVDGQDQAGEGQAREDGVDEAEAFAEQSAAAHGEVPDGPVDPQDQGPVDERNADHHAEQDRGNPIESHGSLLGDGGQLIASSLARISWRLKGFCRLDTRGRPASKGPRESSL